jgi:feruloyl esterase
VTDVNRRLLLDKGGQPQRAARAEPERTTMTRANRMWLVAMSVVSLAVPVARGQGQPGPGRGAGPAQPAPKALMPTVRPVRSCESLATVALPNTTIESAAPDPKSPEICRVTAVTTHPPTGDRVRIWIAIPTTNWNGRFFGTGGGGFSGGSAAGVNQPVSQGYAAGATDTGHEGGGGSFALDASGRLNWQAIRNNAHLGIHEMTVTGKALTQALYGVAPRYAYFSGCSTGGRQGLMEVQRYPQDYNGVVSGAPAINWSRFIPQELWGAVVMNAADNPIPACKLSAATAAAIAACDGIDGAKDGVIEDPKRCAYDPRPLIGTSAGECGSFTEADVTLIRKLWDGPRREDGSFLWYGLPRGADLNTLWGSRGDPLRPQVFGISLDWFRYFLTQNPQLDWTTITPAAYERLWDQSVEQYSAVIGTDTPDLTAFRDRGGKAIVWHGWADQLISAEGTVDYYRRVQQQMGGPQKTASFIRLFMAPGVGHCGGGVGPAPTGQLEALLAWVEEGKAPETLLATRRDATGTVTRSRPLCAYPLVAKYRGSGSTDDAANFACSAGF